MQKGVYYILAVVFANPLKTVTQTDCDKEC